MNPKYPTLSLIIPCLNEQAFIEQMLKDILAQDYDRKLVEILIVDGGSTDKTLRILKKYQKLHKRIKILKNPGSFVPHAINYAIKQSTGSVIVRLDAHANYPPDYLSNLILWLHKTKADNVGGSWAISSVSEAIIPKSIAPVMGHPFSAVFASYRQGFLKYEEEVESVPYGCFPRATFEKYGLLNENLARNHDYEFNKRIARQGGHVMLVPDVYCNYFAPNGFFKLLKKSFSNGKWDFLTPKIVGAKDLLSSRHYVPLFLIIWTVLAVSISLFIPFTPYSVFIFFPILLYIFLIGRASLSIALSEGKIEMLPFIFIAFGVLHTGFGMGSIVGFLGRPKLSKPDTSSQKIETKTA